LTGRWFANGIHRTGASIGVVNLGYRLASDPHYGSPEGIVVANADSTQPLPKFCTINATLGGADQAVVDPQLCVGRGYVAARPQSGQFRGDGEICRHIIFKCFPEAAALSPWVDIALAACLDTCLIQPAAHHLDVGGGIAMCGKDLRMAQPRLDGEQIHPGLQQCHRKRVPKDVGRNGFARQLRHVCRGYGDSPPHNVRRAESGETYRACRRRAGEDHGDRSHVRVSMPSAL
jgi:hypothetical protein